MFKFGFKATFTLSSRKNNFKEDTTERSIVGSYRANKDEFYGNGSLSETKKITPSSVILPPNNEFEPPLRHAKSTSDVTVQYRVPPHLTKSNPNISNDPKGGTSKIRDSAEIREKSKKDKDKNAKTNEKEKKKLEKQQQIEQKRREKIAIQQKLREDKERKEKEKKQAQQEAKKKDKVKKSKPKTERPSVNPLAQNANPVTEVSNAAPQNIPNEQTPQHTNTLGSSISTSSGPPPYSEKPVENKQIRVESGLEEFPKQRRVTGNIRFGKTMDESKSSWDMISQHREHISRPQAAEVRNPRQLNLHYNVGSPLATDVEDNSEA